MRTRVSSTEVARNLGDLLAWVKRRGDRLTIARDGRPVAEPGPVGIVLDTSALVEIERSLDRQMPRSLPGEEVVAISAVVWAEALIGVCLADSPARATHPEGGQQFPARGFSQMGSGRRPRGR